jgi:voltage-dependent calcium channel L type alpha-1D
LAQYIIGGRNLIAIKAFRLLKVLRPLRAISRNQGLKVSIRALGVALGGIVNVMILSMVFYFIFAIIGVNYFKGRFYDCSQAFLPGSNEVSAFTIKSEAGLETKWDCLNLGGIWKNRYINFDNIGEAVSSLYITSKSISWSGIMYRAIYANGID